MSQQQPARTREQCIAAAVAVANAINATRRRSN